VRRRTLTLGTTRGTSRRSTLSLSIRYAILSIASILALELSTLRAKADELPKFSDAEVNQFVSQYADLVTKYIQAYQAAKAGNPSAFDQLKTQVKQLQDEVAKVAEKLKTKPDEAQKYEQFIANYTEKMIDATN
jgi:septal ring factor EnvC (AmiA/AmiB activator)